MAFTEKAKKILKQRSFLFTLALTILGFICIPLLALQSFVITQSTDEFQKTNHQYYLSTLRSSASTFASREQVLSQALAQFHHSGYSSLSSWSVQARWGPRLWAPPQQARLWQGLRSAESRRQAPPQVVAQESPTQLAE